MGCCGSKAAQQPTPAVKGAKPQQKKAPVRIPSLVQTEVYTSLVPVPDIDAEAFVASWPVNKASNIASSIWSGDHYILATMWEGINGKDVAEFANSVCHQQFGECLTNCGNVVDEALREMFVQIDAAFFNSPASSEVKASMGATGMAVYLDVQKKTVWVARLGRTACLLGQLIGGFTQTRAECSVLSQDKESPFSEPVARAAPLTPGSRPLPQPAPGLPPTTPVKNAPTTPTKAGMPPATPVTPVRSSSAGAAEALSLVDHHPYKRALGLGYGKYAVFTEVHNKTLARGCEASPPPEHQPFIRPLVHVTSHQLTSKDRHLLLVTEGVLNMVAPPEAALLASNYSSTQVKPLQERTIGITATTAPIDRPPPAEDAAGAAAAAAAAAAKPVAPQRWHVNVAGILVRRALQKTMDIYNSAHPGAAPVSWANLYQLANTPIPDPCFTALQQALPAQLAADGSFTDPNGSSSQPVADKPFSVERQLAAVVVQLNWPQEEGQQLLPPTTRPANAWAKYRWGLFVQYARFLIARRRQIFARWDVVLAETVRKAKADARAREMAIYRTSGQVVHVSMSGQITSTPDPTSSPARRAPASAPRTGSRSRGGTPIKDPRAYDLRSSARTPSRATTPAASVAASDAEITPTTLVY